MVTSQNAGVEDESEHIVVQTLSVVVGESSLFDDHADSALQLVLGLVPLLLATTTRRSG